MRVRRLFADESGQILRRIITFGLTFAVVILLIVEFGPLIWERFDVAQTADDVANAAANSYYAFHDQAMVVKDVADKLKLAGYTDDEIRQASVQFLPIGGPITSIKVTVVKYANTLITKHINALKKFARIASSKEVSVLQSNK
ncbi:MAG: hypothetical protein ACYC99_09645 [Candidatus Geothermincolia bacterium]